ncbi:MAG: NAD(P)H-binding protein [Acidobacteria bacterium]|nr:NAD(P)H-binding protein [Acidobacteriota bacterium]
MSTVFISGATGYLGRPLTQLLVAAGFEVHALTRPQSIHKLPLGCIPVTGDALDASSFLDTVPLGATYIHLTGVAHPGPAKSAEFRTIDQASFHASLQAAGAASAAHVVYVSVAHPAPVMHDYIAVRRECEASLKESGLNATILRPWYVLGPGHRWPYLLIPLYKVAGLVPGWREGAQRLGLITREQMLAALVHAAANPPAGVRVLGVPEIRAASCAAASASQPAPSKNRRPSTLSA